MIRLYSFFVCMLITQVSCAQRTLLHVVKTKNGTSVNLYSDNTWEYANAAPKEKLSTISYNYGSTSESGGSSASGAGSVKKTTSARKPASARVYHTGPRGGCYYYTAGGSKVYVDRSYCR